MGRPLATLLARWIVGPAAVAVLLVLGASPGPARAEEPASALERLSPGERTYLETNVPDWASLPRTGRSGSPRTS